MILIFDIRESLKINSTSMKRIIFSTFLIVSLLFTGCSNFEPELYIEESSNSIKSSNYRLASYTQKFRDGSKSEAGEYFYSEDGLLNKVITTVYKVDGSILRTATETITHNEQEQLTAIRRVVDTAPSDPIVWSYLYDEEGKLNKVRQLYNLSTSYPVEKFNYDDSGRIISVEGYSDTIAINWEGELLKSRVGKTYSTTYTYNSDGKCIQKLHTNSVRTGKETYTYNDEGNLKTWNYYDDLGIAFTNTFVWESGKSDFDFNNVETSIKYIFGWFN